MSKFSTPYKQSKFINTPKASIQFVVLYVRKTFIKLLCMCECIGSIQICVLSIHACVYTRVHRKVIGFLLYHFLPYSSETRFLPETGVMPAASQLQRYSGVFLPQSSVRRISLIKLVQDLVGAWFVWMLTSIDLGGGGRALDFPLGREP